MKLRFYNAHDVAIIDVWVGQTDHWGACERGFEILSAGIIKGAEDFQVMRRAEDSDFVHIDCAAINPLMEKLRMAA